MKEKNIYKVLQNISPWEKSKYDLHEKDSYEKKQYSLDFVRSDKLEDIEEGIRETIRGVGTANLAIAVAIAKIEREALYRQAGFRTYMESLLSNYKSISSN